MCIANAQFLWINFVYERERLNSWPRILLEKEFLSLNGVSIGISPFLFCVFHFEKVFDEKFGPRMSESLMFLYFILLIILILAVDKKFKNEFKRMKKLNLLDNK